MSDTIVVDPSQNDVRVAHGAVRTYSKAQHAGRFCMQLKSNICRIVRPIKNVNVRFDEDEYVVEGLGRGLHHESVVDSGPAYCNHCVYMETNDQ